MSNQETAFRAIRRRAWRDRKLVFELHGRVQGSLIFAAQMLPPGSLLNRALYDLADRSWSGRWVWTVDEIQAITPFDYGWFTGFVRHEGRLHFGEIYPGMGFTDDWPQPWWDPRSWWRAARDVLLAKPRLAAVPETEQTP